MDFSGSIEAYMHHCHSRKLRPKTMLSYEQTLKLFGVWLADTTAVTRVEDIREKHIRAYIVELQERGKYTQVADRRAQKYNCPQNRRDYGELLVMDEKGNPVWDAVAMCQKAEEQAAARPVEAAADKPKLVLMKNA